MSGRPAPPDVARRAVFRPRAFLLFASGSALVVLALAGLNPVPLFLALPLLLAPVAAFLEAPTEASTATLRWEESGSAETVRIRGEIAPAPAISAASLRVRL